MEGYSEVRIVTEEAMRLARYVIISPNPEDDVIGYMEMWAQRSGLLAFPGYTPRRIGWDYAIPKELEKQGLRGYVCAYVLPEGFTPGCPGAEVWTLERDRYAVITVEDPMTEPFRRIPEGYHRLIAELQRQEIFPEDWEGRTCWEEYITDDAGAHMVIRFPAGKRLAE